MQCDERGQGWANPLRPGPSLRDMVERVRVTRNRRANAGSTCAIFLWWMRAEGSVFANVASWPATVNLRQLQRHWNEFGKTDPLYAVLSHPGMQGGKWDVDEFLATGRRDIDAAMTLDAKYGPVAKAAALDFGCGAGRLTQALAEHFDRVVGVDIAASMIEEARALNRFGERCEFVVNTTDDLSLFGNDSFDLVYSDIVLQHMDPRYAGKYIREFLRLVRPSGLVFFQVPEPMRWQFVKALAPEWALAVYRRARGRAGPVMQMFGMTSAQVQRLVNEAGGRVVASRPTGSAGKFPAHIYVCGSGV